jgi:hypothetical protein
MDKHCIVGGLIFTVLVVTVPSPEVCERKKSSASACPLPRFEWNHDHSREPQRPFVQPSYVLGTSTGTGGLSISTSFATGALTLTDVNGVDVTESYRA